MLMPRQSTCSRPAPSTTPCPRRRRRCASPARRSGRQRQRSGRDGAAREPGASVLPLRHDAPLQRGGERHHDGQGGREYRRGRGVGTSGTAGRGGRGGGCCGGRSRGGPADRVREPGPRLQHRLQPRGGRRPRNPRTADRPPPYFV